MSDVGDAIDEVRVDLATDAADFMADVCSLIPPPALVAQGAGHTFGTEVPVTGIPCNHEQIGGGGITFHDGESVVTKTHKLELPFTSSTVAITRQYKIKVTARGLNPQLIFEQPVIDVDSLSPLLQVFAVLTEGYRQPGIT